jgi:hypothetical protein
VPVSVWTDFSYPVVSILDGYTIEVLNGHHAERIRLSASTARRRAKSCDPLWWKTASWSHGCMVSFSSVLISLHKSCSYVPSLFTIHALANHNEPCPLGMRVADPLVFHRIHTVKEALVMKGTAPMLSEQDRHVQRLNLRRYVREMVNLRMIVADTVGLASGEVIDVTTRGCGLRLTKPLRPGQYLTLMMYPNDGTAFVLCDLAKVQWVKEDRAGVAFLRMSLENELRLRRLCGDWLVSEYWD